MSMKTASFPRIKCKATNFILNAVFFSHWIQKYGKLFAECRNTQTVATISANKSLHLFKAEEIKPTTVNTNAETITKWKAIIEFRLPNGKRCFFFVFICSLFLKNDYGIMWNEAMRRDRIVIYRILKLSFGVELTLDWIALMC